jgi:hypothetical protein
MIIEFQQSLFHQNVLMIFFLIFCLPRPCLWGCFYLRVLIQIPFIFLYVFVCLQYSTRFKFLTSILFISVQYISLTCLYPRTWRSCPSGCYAGGPCRVCPCSAGGGRPGSPAWRSSCSTSRPAQPLQAALPPHSASFYVDNRILALFVSCIDRSAYM